MIAPQPIIAPVIAPQAIVAPVIAPQAIVAPGFKQLARSILTILHDFSAISTFFWSFFTILHDFFEKYRAESSFLPISRKKRGVLSFSQATLLWLLRMVA